MNKKILSDILKTDVLKLTKSEIESIMNEELEKDPEEMDTELVDLCLEALEGKQNIVSLEEAKERKKKKFSFRKIAGYVIVFLGIVSSVAVIVDADVSFFEIKDKFIDRNYTYVNVYPDGITDVVLPDALSEMGAESVYLPEGFSNGGAELLTCEKSKYRGVINNISFTFRTNDPHLKGNGYIQVDTRYLDWEFNYKNYLYNEKINGVEVFVVEDVNGYIVEYFNENVSYYFSLESTYNQAVNFAESLVKYN